MESSFDELELFPVAVKDAVQRKVNRTAPACCFSYDWGGEEEENPERYQLYKMKEALRRKQKRLEQSHKTIF